ncbi:MAG: hypothetical protein P8O07_04760 [Crocinitomicaceae bacterium]|nr:hypothetical protein [Crocinitomicaceae bacterium]
MKKLIPLFSVGLLFLFTNCQEAEDTIQEAGFTSYFFPTDSLVPYIYVFSDEKRPLDERFFRMYRLENDRDTSFVVERFNSSFKITEGFTFKLNDSLTVIDHMIVDRDGLKRQSNVTSNYSFPMYAHMVAHFIADFPGVTDSTVIVQDSKKHIFNPDTTYVLFGNELPAILVKDTIRWYELSSSSSEVREQMVVTDNIYVKGYGLVEWGSEDKSVVFTLRVVLSDAWWSEHAQAPQVRF